MEEGKFVFLFALPRGMKDAMKGKGVPSKFHPAVHAIQGIQLGVQIFRDRGIVKGKQLFGQNGAGRSLHLVNPRGHFQLNNSLLAF